MGPECVGGVQAGKNFFRQLDVKVYKKAKCKMSVDNRKIVLRMGPMQAKKRIKVDILGKFYVND